MLNHEPILRSALGCAALIQITFLPGYLLLRHCRWARGELQTLLLAFALSLPVNFYLVTLLVALNLYTPPVILGIFLLEVVAFLAWPRRRPLESSPAGDSDLARLIRFGEDLWQGNWLHRALRITVAAWALFALCQAFRTLLAHWGDIFFVWDEVTSWNRWALDWAANHWPQRTMGYPQLLPANLSLTYVFMDDPRIWMFAKGLMPLFPLAILLLVADLALRMRHDAYLLAVPITALLIKTIIGPASTLGYADGPLAFLIAAALYVCILEYLPAGPQTAPARTESLLAPILAAAAALTKISGWYAGLALCLIAWRWRRDNRAAPTTPTGPWLARWLALALLLPLPWYALDTLQLGSFRDREINAREVLVFAHHDRSPAARVTFGMRQLAHNGGAVGVFAAGLALTALASRRWRWPAALAFGWTAVWSLGLSYDTRNLAPALPFLGLAAAAGALATLQDRTRGRTALAALAGCFALGVANPADQLEAAQAAKQMNLGVPDVNNALHQYAADRGFDGKILSNYNFMPFDRTLEPYYVHEYFHTFDSFHDNLIATRPRYLLYATDWCDKDIAQYIAANLQSGDFTLIAAIGRWNFIRVAREITFLSATE